MGTEASSAVVRDERGEERPLGDWLTDLLARSKQSVTRVADRAHLSRSFYYLIKEGRQVPSVESLANLLEALDVDEVRVAAPMERADLYAVVDGVPFWITLPRSGRRAVRSRSAWNSLATSSRSAVPITYSLGSDEPKPRSADERTRLLGELLHYAGDMDAQRLRLLVAHAELMARE